jgi:hypothetical protein
MEPVRDPKILARIRATSDLYEAAEALMRQQLHRRHPRDSAAQIERRLVLWLQQPRTD